MGSTTKKLGLAVMTGGLSLVPELFKTPEIPKQNPAPVVTTDQDAMRERARRRSREAIFGGRRGTMLADKKAVFNTGQKKLMGE